ncbi:MAG: Ku protein [Candidatus Woesebacteria bacterium]|jgi:DNA end-binding protein Ku
MRPVWNGSISFGLVSIPVSAFAAANPRQGIDLTMLHKDDGGSIRYARICRKDGQEIPWNDIAKGYEYQEGDYVVLTQKELDRLGVKKSQTIDIMQFVDEPEIDIRYFEKPYYLEPQKGGEKAYALLREAMQKTGKLALASFVMHEHSRLAAIKPVGKVLVLNQMRYPSDLRNPRDLQLPSTSGLASDEIDMALKLIKQNIKPFIPEDLKDSYTDELEDLINAKVKGQKPKMQSKERQATTKDLMSALKASLKG